MLLSVEVIRSRCCRLPASARLGWQGCCFLPWHSLTQEFPLSIYWKLYPFKPASRCGVYEFFKKYTAVSLLYSSFYLAYCTVMVPVSRPSPQLVEYQRCFVPHWHLILMHKVPFSGCMRRGQRAFLNTSLMLYKGHSSWVFGWGKDHGFG